MIRGSALSLPVVVEGDWVEYLISQTQMIHTIITIKNIPDWNQHFPHDLPIVTTWLQITSLWTAPFRVRTRHEIWIHFWHCVTMGKQEKSHSCHVIIFYLLADNNTDHRIWTLHSSVAHFTPYIFSDSKQFRRRTGLSFILLWHSGNTVLNIVNCKGKGKAVPLQDWSDPEGSRSLRFPDFMTTVQDGGKIVNLTHWPPLLPGNTPGTHVC